MTTLEEVRTMMPVVTEFSLPTDTTAQTLYDLASSKVTGLSGDVETQGYCYYIAYLMSSKGNFGVSSEHLGSYSVTYGGKATNPYLAQYNELIRASRLSAFTIGTHEDAEYMQDYPLDGNRVSL